MSGLIPIDARRAMVELRENVSLETFLDFVWQRRAIEHPGETVVRGHWPFVREVDKNTDSGANIRHVSTTLRRKA
jgi:hypothetical protein